MAASRPGRARLRRKARPPKGEAAPGAHQARLEQARPLWKPEREPDPPAGSGRLLVVPVIGGLLRHRLPSLLAQSAGRAASPAVTLGPESRVYPGTPPERRSAIYRRH